MKNKCYHHSAMRKKKRGVIFLILLVAFPIVLMGGGLFLCCRSSGFNIHKITSRLSYNRTWDVEPLSLQQKELLTRKIFPQTFYYLASGNQCYAFISEDRKYILKFFKMRNCFPKGWLNSFPLFILQRIGFKYESGNCLFSERIFANYKDAYESLREETGLIYVHLNKTSEFKSQVVLIDNKGKSHLLNLDTVEFVVQQRAQRIYDHFNELIRQENDEELKVCIRSFLQLIASRCEKGFVDQHLNIRNNFGFIGHQAIQFGCGALTRDDSMKYPLNFRNEILQAAERLDHWARADYPDATLFIQEEAQKIINHSS